MQTKQLIIAGILFIAGIAIGVILSRAVPPATPAAGDTVESSDNAAPAIRPVLGPPPSEMDYLEYRFVSDKIEPGSHAASVRKLWRAGNHFLRLEKQPDTDNNRHQIIISNAPDNWYWDRISNTARYVLDKGPTYNVILPAFAVAHSASIRSLQIGREKVFFEQYDSTAVKETEIGDTAVEEHRLELDDYVLHLYTGKASGVPLRMTLSRHEEEPELIVAIDYEQYETGLPFDEQKFTLPGDVGIQSGTTEN